MILQSLQIIAAIVALHAAGSSSLAEVVVPSSGRYLYERLAAGRLEGWEIERSAHIEGLAPALVALAEKLISGRADFEHVYFVLDALRARGDLGNDELKWVRFRLRPLLGKNDGPLGDVVKDRCLSILSKYPCEENETILIEFLSDKKEGDNEFGYSAVAAMGLRRVGTVRSVGPLRKYAEKLRSIPGVDPDGSAFVELFELIKKLEAQAGDSAQGASGGPGEIVGLAQESALMRADVADPPSENNRSRNSEGSEPVSLARSKWQLLPVLCLALTLKCGLSIKE